MTIDVSGDWILDGRPFDTAYGGQVGFSLQQSGSRIVGDLVQLQDPGTGQPPPERRRRVRMSKARSSRMRGGTTTS